MQSIPSRYQRTGGGYNWGQNAPQRPQNPQAVPPWKLWDSVAVGLRNVPNEATALILWQAFSREGNVCSVDLYEDEHGNRGTRGKVRFRPPPETEFWRSGRYEISLPGDRRWAITVALDPKQPGGGIQSPVRPGVWYPAETILPAWTMQVGVLVGGATFLPLRTVGAGVEEKASLVVDLRQRSLLLYFQLRTVEAEGSYHQYRVKIPFTQLNEIFQTRDGSGGVSHLAFLDGPPFYYRRAKNVSSSFTDNNTWREADAWLRQASIVANPQAQEHLPASLRKHHPVIDIGRWSAFKITYPTDADERGKLTMLCHILSDYNIVIEETDKFMEWNINKGREPPVWKWIDLPETTHSSMSSSLAELFDQTYVHLPFSVRYQLEVCLSHGYLSEFAMTREFVVKLAELEEAEARKLLEHVASKKKPYYNPMDIFDISAIKGVTDAKIPPHCCYMRSARITPSTIYYNTPSMDLSNRVVRRHGEHADRFLRVRFTDEKNWGRINSIADNTMDDVFSRIKRVLMNGIVIGDRRYEFLAFGNSQLREHGAYFFAPLPNLSAANIRAWMGDFKDIRNVARNAARLGQCFSTTRAVIGCPAHVVEVDDIERNGYVFSDGVGMISKFLSLMVMAEHHMVTPSGEPPSAFQFRLGGSKGMLVHFPQAQRQEVLIRPSQTKFSANHHGLEIIRWSQFSAATMNRQIIMVLSSLGIDDRVFNAKLETMMAGLDEAMANDLQAINMLRKYVDPNHRSLVLSRMVHDGFRRSNEPFMVSILELWRVWNLKYLKEKARIVIDEGACLLGCLDETSTLKGVFLNTIPKEDAPYEEKLAALPEVFVQICRPENGRKYEVIEGLCIVARNPSLHPGDIRVVRAVNVPQLRHVRDVIVFPQTGDRDVPSMCSGGDLDGDDYLVIWDPDLIPDHWFRAPMKYVSNKAQDFDRAVTVDDITTFFVKYMKSDCLPRIAHAHLAWADQLGEGVGAEKCIRLAQLHSDAVDYNKTGVPAVLTRSLTPWMWPHFMEKKGKPPTAVYKSPKILGQIYDAVQRTGFEPRLETSFDKRILNSDIEVSEDLLQFARVLKDEYDSAMRRMMAQHEIRTEFEVWTTFVLSHANMSKDYKFHEEIGAMSTYLQKEFRKHCYDKVGGRSAECVAPLAVAMYRVTHEEMSEALKKRHTESSMAGLHFNNQTQSDELPLISFPWIFPDVLGKIAIGYSELPPYSVDDTASVDLEVDKDGLNGKGVLSSQAELGTTHAPGAQETSLLECDTVIQTQPHPSSSRNVTKETEDSADLLASFGFTSVASRGPSDTTILSGEEVNLMDFSDGPNSATDDKGKQPMKENVKATPMGQGQKENTEIVEDEGALGQTALDQLNQLLGI